MRYGFLIVLGISAFPFGNLHAQLNATAKPLPDYVFRTIDNSDGLLSNHVLAISQDRRGYIWIGDKKHLQRYDGSRFVNYHDTTTIPPEIHPLVTLYPDDRTNAIWVVRHGYHTRQLQVLRNEFTSLRSEQVTNKRGDNYVDWDGGTWSLQRSNIPEAGKLAGKHKGHVFVTDPRGTVYSGKYLTDRLRGETWTLTTRYGWILFDDKTHKIYSPGHNNISHPILTGIKGQSIVDMVMDSRENIWLITWGPLFYRYNTISRQLHSYSIANVLNAQGRGKILTGSANIVMEDNHGTVWIGTTNAGLLQYDPVKDHFDYILNRQDNTTGIQYNYAITTLFQDKQENIWVGTDKGISIFNPYRKYFTILKHEQYNTRSLPQSEISAVIQTARGDLLVGTWGGGISVYDKDLRFIKTLHFPDTASKNEIWCLAQNDDGTIWAGTQGGYIHIIDTARLSLRTIHPPELERSSIMCMTKDAAGNLWFGLYNGKVAQWNREQKKFIPYNNMFQANSPPPVPVMTIFVDRSQNFWISGWGGLRLFDVGKGIFTATYLPDKQNNNAISSAFSLGIEEYNDSILLVGTKEGGLNFFNKRKKTFTHLTTADGLPENTVYSLKKDTAGYIWFTTEYGLYKFKPADNKFIPYNVANKLVNSSFSSYHFYPLQDGQWLNFSNSETISFFPYKTDSDNRQTRTEITGFKLFDKPMFIDSLLYENKPVRLSYKQNFFAIEFASLNFSGSLQTNYYYRLEGVDNDWVNSGPNLFANYTSLQPGKYVFSVKAENGNSIGETTSFTIIITPPFWKTWWFLTVSAILISLAMYALFRRRIHTIRTEAELKHKIAETEMIALRAQMNPHFIFNCLNSIDNLIQTGEKEKATNYLSKFAKLIRAILENSKHNVIPCWKDLETLELYLELEVFRWDNKFSYRLSVATEILQGDYKVPPLVIQPFVENAIHHGLLNKTSGEKNLRIAVTIENNNIRYVVEDNGIGRQQAGIYKKLNEPASTSLGMQLTTDRIKLFNQNGNGAVTITDLVNDGVAAGTRVEILLVNQS